MSSTTTTNLQARDDSMDKLLLATSFSILAFTVSLTTIEQWLRIASAIVTLALSAYTFWRTIRRKQ